MDVSKNRDTPKWMVKIMENPIKMDDLGVPLFLETPRWWFGWFLVEQIGTQKWCFVLPDTLGFKVMLFTLNRGRSLLKHHLRENISWELYASIKEANPSV